MRLSKYQVISIFFNVNSFIIILSYYLFPNNNVHEKCIRFLKLFYMIDTFLSIARNPILHMNICMFFFPFSLINLFLCHTQFLTHFSFLYNFFKLFQLLEDNLYRRQQEEQTFYRSQIFQIDDSSFYSCFQNINDENDNDDVCYICLETDKEKPGLKRISCRHVFHIPCLKEWISHKRNFHCPVCKAVFFHPNQ